MATYSNGSEGDGFYEQCAKCKYGEKPCPIALLQFNYNYEAMKNEVAKRMLGDMVAQDGTCSMYNEFIEDFRIDTSQSKLFDVDANYERPTLDGKEE